MHTSIEKGMETEGDQGDWRDFGDQWICTLLKKKV